MSYKYYFNQPTSCRLDQFLVLKGISSSRAQIAKWIKEGNVFVNDKVSKASLKLKNKDLIIVIPPKLKKSLTLPEEIPLHILYEDPDLLVINKSPSMVVHPGAGHFSGTLTNALLSHCKGLSQIGGVERPGIVHRLDKGTSGVMVIAKNDQTHSALANQFKNHEVTKIYWAVVYGQLKKKKGVFESLITRSSSDRKKFTVSKTKGKKAITEYNVLKEKCGLSLVELSLKTGRTHQIRVHLTDAGHSIVGDPTYGGHKKRLVQIQDPVLKNRLVKLDHTLLHAQTLTFYHPVKKEWMEFKAALPEEFERVIEFVF